MILMPSTKILFKSTGETLAKLLYLYIKILSNNRELFLKKLINSLLIMQNTE